MGWQSVYGWARDNVGRDQCVEVLIHCKQRFFCVSCLFFVLAKKWLKNFSDIWGLFCHRRQQNAVQMRNSIWHQCGSSGVQWPSADRTGGVDIRSWGICEKYVHWHCLPHYELFGAELERNCSLRCVFLFFYLFVCVQALCWCCTARACASGAVKRAEDANITMGKKAICAHKSIWWAAPTVSNQ